MYPEFFTWKFKEFGGDYFNGMKWMCEVDLD